MHLVGAFSILREADDGAPSARRVWVAAYAQRPHDGALACGYSDGSVALWDVREGEARERRLVYAPGPQDAAYDAVLSMAFSPDGTLLVSTNHGRTPDRAAYVWDVRTGELVHRLGGFGYRLYAAAFSPDGHVLALAGDDQIVKLFDVGSGDECPPAFARLPHAVSALAFSPDGRYLVAGCDGELLVIYDLTAGTEQRLEGHLEWTYALAYSPRGHVFASGGEDQLVWLWEVESGRRLRELRGHGVAGIHRGGEVYSVAFSPDGARVADASADMTARVADASADMIARLWDVTTGRPVGTLGHPARDARDLLRWVAFQPDGDEVLTGTTSGRVSRWRRAAEQDPRAEAVGA